MALIRFDPFRELDSFRSQMNRLIDDSFGPAKGGDDSMLSRGWAPKVDIFEDQDNITVTAELPGMEQKDVEVRIEDATLIIKGERKLEHEEKKDNYHRIERSYGSFSRSFSLPTNLALDKVEAKMDKGVLKVMLPRKEEAKPKQIEVKVK